MCLIMLMRDMDHIGKPVGPNDTLRNLIQKNRCLGFLLMATSASNFNKDGNSIAKLFMWNYFTYLKNFS